MTSPADQPTFRDAVAGLLRGDFSASEPLFDPPASEPGAPCHIVEWFAQGWFDGEPQALAEAFTCACFLGRTSVARFLLDKGVDSAGGSATGLNAAHWAANRGQLETVKLLIERKAPLEIENMYGGTVLGCALWSALYEPHPDHVAIIAALLAAGAKIEDGSLAWLAQQTAPPSLKARLAELLRRHGAES